MTLAELQKRAWQAADLKGFHDGRTNDRDDTLVRLCLIHSEVSEAVQVVKRGWTADPSAAVADALAEELADVAIRLMDLAECCGISLTIAIEDKMEKNATRPRLYGTPGEQGAKGCAK